MNECQTCNGSGLVGQLEDCIDCEGTGQMSALDRACREIAARDGLDWRAVLSEAKRMIDRGAS